MSRWSEWIHHALEPTREEVTGVTDPLSPELVDWARNGTDPLDAEVEVVLRRLAEVEVSPGHAVVPWILGGSAVGLIAVGAAVAVWLAFMPGAEVYGPLPFALGEAVQLADATVVELGPSIDLRADHAEVIVARADERGTVVDLVDGAARFEVDPAGAFRNLLVRVDEVEVEVEGTVFEVERTGAAVQVRVTRGKVAVRAPGVRTFVEAGDTWTWPEVTSVVVAPVVPEPVREPEAVVVVRPRVAPPRRVPTPPSTPPERAVEPTSQVLAWHRFADAQTALASGRADEVRAIAAEPDVAALLTEQPKLAAELDAGILLVEADTGSEPRRTVDGIDGFLLAHPDSPRKADLRWARATLLRDRLEDCEAALPDYRQLAPLGGDRAPLVHAYRGICALAVGRTTEARNALERALQLGVDEPLRSQVQRRLDALDAAP